jgi:hypothetical protein
MTRTSENGGVDHIHKKVRTDEGFNGLTEEEAKEQLLWDLRNQLGVITFETIEDSEGRGDGVVIANINGRQVDHFIYYEQ